jgi:hypothetical protein
MKLAVSVNKLKSIILYFTNKIRVIIVKTKMKTSNKALIGTSALVAVILAGAYSSSSAYQGDYSQKGPNYSDERHEIMEEAFENNNYNTWKDQMNDRGRVKDVVTEENFSKFAEAHRLGLEGKIAEADEIRKELGLRTSDGERMGAGYGKGDKEGRGQGQGRMNNENRGQNQGGNFVDANGDGSCDNLK